jgi:hypothetical protein
MNLRGNSRENLNESRVGLSGLSPFRSDGSQDSQAQRLSHVSSGIKQLKSGYQAPVHSDKMVLAMARQGGWNT